METNKIGDGNMDTSSLNRTMQYGNPLTETDNNAKEYSLNRTMQYGNICSEYMNI